MTAIDWISTRRSELAKILGSNQHALEELTTNLNKLQLVADHHGHRHKNRKRPSGALQAGDPQICYLLPARRSRLPKIDTNLKSFPRAPTIQADLEIRNGTKTADVTK